MAHADVDLDVWIRKLFFYCGDGASVVEGECGGIIRIVGDLQKEIAGYDVVVPYHEHCHRCELAFKAAIAADHAFLDLLADTLQCAALFWNNAPCRLKTLHALAQFSHQSVGSDGTQVIQSASSQSIHQSF